MLPPIRPDGTLPPGRHPATLAELHEIFVNQAPNALHRQMIFDAFTIWARTWWALFPTARLWVDGGFVIHKPQPPKDIDVVGFAKASQVDDLSKDDQSRFESLLTSLDPIDKERRIQPMGGLVDGFFARRADPNDYHEWATTWSAVTDEEKRLIHGRQKGYLEVKNQ